MTQERKIMSKADELLKRWLNPFSEHEIIDETEAYLNRKDRLVEGSEWVCDVSFENYCTTYYKGDIYKISKIHERMEKIWLNDGKCSIMFSQFLACFIPKEFV